MKKGIIIAILAVICIAGFAQDKRYKYCVLSSKRIGLTKDMNIYADFGKTLNVIVDSKTMEPRIFQSILEPINEMTETGWELYQTYVLNDEGNSYSRWVMRKDVNKTDKTASTLTFKVVDVKLMQNGHLVAF